MDVEIVSINISNLQEPLTEQVGNEPQAQTKVSAEETAAVTSINLFELAANLEVPSFSLFFINRSQLYDWINKGNDPKKVTDLVIQDGWSSRNVDTIAGQEYRDQDIAYLAERFTNVRSIKFNCSHYYVTDKAMKELKKMPHLTSVWLRELHRLTDDGLNELSLACPQVQTLILEALPNVTGSRLDKTLANLPRLQSLELLRSYPHAGAPIHWATLAKALMGTSISHLQFSTNFDTGNGLDAISIWQNTFATMPNLRSITLTREEAYQARTILSAASAIHTLNLWGTELDEDVELPASIKTLDLAGYVFNRGSLPSIFQKAIRLPQLEKFSILSSSYPANYSDIDLAHFLTTGFPALKEFRFNDDGHFNHHIDQGLPDLVSRLQLLRPDVKFLFNK